MNAITDKVINVPITDDDIIRTVSQLPGLPHDAGIIAVDFKRRTDMKSFALKEYVYFHRLGPALTKLKELGHPGYQFIKINADRRNSVQIQFYLKVNLHFLPRTLSIMHKIRYVSTSLISLSHYVSLILALKLLPSAILPRKNYTSILNLHLLLPLANPKCQLV